MNLSNLLQPVIDKAMCNGGIAYLFLGVAPDVKKTAASNLKEVTTCEVAFTLAELEESLFRVDPAEYDVIQIDMSLNHTVIYYGTADD